MNARESSGVSEKLRRVGLLMILLTVGTSVSFLFGAPPVGITSGAPESGALYGTAVAPMSSPTTNAPLTSFVATSSPEQTNVSGAGAPAGSETDYTKIRLARTVLAYGGGIVLFLIAAVGGFGTWHYKRKYNSQQENIDEIFEELNETADRDLSINDTSAEKLLENINKGKITTADSGTNSITASNGNAGSTTTAESAGPPGGVASTPEPTDGAETGAGSPGADVIESVRRVVDGIAENNSRTDIGSALDQLSYLLNSEANRDDTEKLRTHLAAALDQESEHRFLQQVLSKYDLNGNIPADPQWMQLTNELTTSEHGDELTGMVCNLAESLHEYQEELEAARETKRNYRHKANNFDVIVDNLDQDWIDSHLRDQSESNSVVAGVESGAIGVRKAATAVAQIDRTDPPRTNFVSVLGEPEEHDQSEVRATAEEVLDDLEELRAIEAEMGDIDQQSLESKVDQIAQLSMNRSVPGLPAAVDSYLKRINRDIETIPEDNAFERHAYHQGLTHVHQLIESMAEQEQPPDIDALKSDYREKKRRLEARQAEDTHDVTGKGHKIADLFVELADTFVEQANTEATSGNDQAAQSLYTGALELLDTVRELYDEKDYRKHMRRL